MKDKSIGQKALSIAIMATALLLMVASLILDASGNQFAGRGPMLIVGIIAFLFGIYKFPTPQHHRAIVYIIFLFPLLFTFFVTVIIPLILGIGYSFTDWTGVSITKNVGFANYSTMFHDPAF